EEDFANDREQLDWYLDINRQFADWLNKLIRKKFPDIKYDIGDSEHTEWQREIEDMSKYYERAGKGVFL
ncbi:MAG: type I-F CRISPR-associated protein Csy1, partial [Pseudomonadales bacterium]